MDALDVAGLLEFDCIVIRDELLESSEASRRIVAEKWEFTKASLGKKSSHCSEDAHDVDIKVEGEVVHIDVEGGEDEDVDVEGDEPVPVIQPPGNIQSRGVGRANVDDAPVAEVPEPKDTRRGSGPKHPEGVADRDGTCISGLPQTTSAPFTCNSCSRHFSSESELTNHIFTFTGQVDGSLQTFAFCRKVFSGANSSTNSEVRQAPEMARKKLGKSPKCKILSDSSDGVLRPEDFAEAFVVSDSEVGSTRANTCKGHLSKLSEAGASAASETSGVGQLFYLKRTVGMCGICGKIFMNNSNLKRHKVHDKGILLSCDVCGQFFRDRISLWRHKDQHVGKARSKIHKCSVCGKQVTSYNSLRKHRAQHVQPYMCNVCGESFHLPSGLQIHKYLHAR